MLALQRLSAGKKIRTQEIPGQKSRKKIPKKNPGSRPPGLSLSSQTG
jgi:hypothetical protein